MPAHVCAARLEAQPAAVAEGCLDGLEHTALQHDDRAVVDHPQCVAAPAAARRGRDRPVERSQAGWYGGRHERGGTQPPRGEIPVHVQDIGRAAGRRAQCDECHARHGAERSSHPGATITGACARRQGGATAARTPARTERRQATRGGSRSTAAASVRAWRRFLPKIDSSARTVAKMSSGPFTSAPSSTSTSSSRDARSPAGSAAKGMATRRPVAGAWTTTSTTARCGRRLGLSVGGRSRQLRSLRLHEVYLPHRSHVVPDPSSAQAGVHLDDARTATRALALHVQNPAVQSEGLDGLHDEFDEPADLLAIVVGRAVQAGLLERRLGRGPVLRHAGEDAGSVVHDQIDVELHAVEVLLEEQVVPGSEDPVGLGPHDGADERIEPRQRFEVVDPYAAHRARPELRLHDGGEADVGGCGEELVERADATRLRRGQSELRRQLTGPHLAAGRVNRIRRIRGKSQSGGDTCGHADAVLPEGQHAIGPDGRPVEGVEDGGCVPVGVADDGRRQPRIHESLGPERLGPVTGFVQQHGAHTELGQPRVCTPLALVAGADHRHRRTVQAHACTHAGSSTSTSTLRVARRPVCGWRSDQAPTAPSERTATRRAGRHLPGGARCSAPPSSRWRCGAPRPAGLARRSSHPARDERAPRRRGGRRHLRR